MFRSSLIWLIPGMRVKRWLVLILFGAVLANVGSVFAFGNTVVEGWASLLVLMNLPEQYYGLHHPVGLATMAIGVVCMLVSAYLLVRSIAREIDPEKALRLADVVNRNRLERIARGAEIVVIGGGTGLSTMLRGLKSRTGNITAVVTVSDDGGSSGRLQRELGILPPGDIRNCLVALADEEPLMTAIFNHRFQVRPPVTASAGMEGLPLLAGGADGGGSGDAADGRGGLAGHSLGNLFLAALTQLNHGNFDKAVQAASRVLAIRGQVLPSTMQQVSLIGEMKDGSRLRGETAIVASRRGIERICLDPPDPATFPEVVEAILSASLVVIGPGSVYTSVIPNLLVPSIRDALERTRAIRVYVCNVMTQPGESDGFTAADHLAAIHAQTAYHPADYVLVNVQEPKPEQLERYRRIGADWVRPDVERVLEAGCYPVISNLISESDLVRHDSEALARELFRLLDNRKLHRQMVAARGRRRTASGSLHTAMNRELATVTHTPEEGERNGS